MTCSYTYSCKKFRKLRFRQLEFFRLSSNISIVLAYIAKTCKFTKTDGFTCTTLNTRLQIESMQFTRIQDEMGEVGGGTRMSATNSRKNYTKTWKRSIKTVNNRLEETMNIVGTEDFHYDNWVMHATWNVRKTLNLFWQLLCFKILTIWQNVFKFYIYKYFVCLT